MSGILFVKTSSLGDVVHNLPAVSDAARLRPGTPIAWVVEESFVDIAALHPTVRQIIPVATRRWRQHPFDPATWREIAAVRRNLAAWKADVVIDTQGLVRSGIVTCMTTGERHGYDRDSIREPFASRFYDVTHRVARAQHAVARNRALTAAALGSARTDLPLDYGLIRAAPSRPRSAVLLHGTSRADKEWPEANWVALGRHLIARGYRVVLPAGSPTEAERSRRLASAIDGAEILDRKPLRDVAAIIAAASLVVGVDTGLLHLAAAYGIDLVGVYGATDPMLTGPVGTGRIAIAGRGRGQPSLDEVLAAISA